MASCGFSFPSTDLSIPNSVCTDEGWYNLAAEFGPGSQFYEEFHGKPPPATPLEKSVAIYRHGTIMYYGGSLSNHLVEQKFTIHNRQHLHHEIVNKAF